MTYNVAELVISSGFWFLIGFVIAKVRPKNALREALYKAHPELKPNMVFTVDDKLEIMFWPYESTNLAMPVTATILTEENRNALAGMYQMPDIRVGDYFILDPEPRTELPEVFEYHYERVNAP